MMHRAEHFRYYKDEELQALELPYAGYQFSMVVLLPQKQDGIKTFEAKLSAGTVTQLISSMRTRVVDAFIPKFKVSFGTELSECLKTMGMPEAFGKDADFSGMDGVKDLYISAVVHKAFADVNENGTEAAAASAVLMCWYGIELGPPPIFRADHPFVFLIRDMKSGSILFMGRVMDPTK